MMSSQDESCMAKFLELKFKNHTGNNERRIATLSNIERFSVEQAKKF